MKKLLFMITGLLLTTSSIQNRLPLGRNFLGREQIRNARVDLEPEGTTSSPTLINMSANFEFDTFYESYGDDKHYDVENPDHRSIVPKYRAKKDEKSTPTNCSFVRPWAIDESGVKHYFSTEYSLSSPISVFSNGAVSFGMDSYSGVATNCKIRNLKNVAINSAAFRVATGNPKIGTGIVLYCSASTNDEYYPDVWENYMNFNQFVDQTIDIYFPVNRYCQVMFLYQVDNYSNDFFKKHEYYSVLGICSFMTTPFHS